MSFSSFKQHLMTIPKTRDNIKKIAVTEQKKSIYYTEPSSFSLHVRASKMSASTIFLFVTSAGGAKDAPELVRETVAAGWKTYTVLTPNVSSVLPSDEIYGVLGSHAIRNYMDPPLDIFPFGAMLVAPCTFNTFNKLALGLADNLATSMIADALGTRCPIFIAPSMNYGLWSHPQTRISEAKLKEWGCIIIPPCINEKIVTMASVTDILQVLHQHFK